MENLIFTLVERGFGWNLVRNIFATLDNVAFFLFSKVMGLLFDIANLTAQKGDAITTFLEPLQGRIYVVLSIYMVFKVTISLLTYIVNPDAMTDKNQGAGKLVQRIIVSLAILSFFPYGFKMLNKLQADIIGNETIPKLVLGVSGSVDSPEGIGTEIAYEVYNGTFVSEGGGKVSTSPETVDEIVKNINEPADGDNSQYKYEYIPFAGFAVGMLLTVLTLSMCIDVAVRVFKLIILQMVAPIPIISYMDPKQAKDGAFSKWIKLTIKTWAEVFIRLFVIYFILLVIENLISNGGALVNDSNLFVKIALVIGLLFFAKDAPKFICEAIGIKDVPKGGLFGGLGSIMAAGAIGAGVVSGAIIGAQSASAADEALGRNPNLLRNVGAGLFGAAGGLATGISAANGAKDHHTRAIMDAMAKKNARVMELGRSGGTFWGGVGAGATRLFTGQTLGSRLEANWKRQEEAIKYDKQRNAERKTIMDRASSKGLESLATSAHVGQFKGVSGKIYDFDANAAQFNSALSAAEAAGKDSFDFNGTSIDMKDAKLLQHEINEGNIANYAEQSLAGTINDAVITAANDRFASANEGVGVETTFGGANGLKATYGSTNNEISKRERNLANQKNSASAQAATANDKRFGGK